MIADPTVVFDNDKGSITVHGVSTSCAPYAIEFPAPWFAARWAHVLQRNNYSRRTMGPPVTRWKKPKVTVARLVPTKATR
jgi:hypothetical protein